MAVQIFQLAFIKREGGTGKALREEGLKINGNVGVLFNGKWDEYKNRATFRFCFRSASALVLLQ